MRRTLIIIAAGLGATAVFAVLVHCVLVVAHASEPAANTVHAFTARRAWATTASLVALVGVFSGGMATYRSFRHAGTFERRGAIVALVAGPIAGINGGLNLAVATGGPGTGNGVVGAAVAFVLGLIAIALGGAALARSRHLELS